MNYHKLTGIEHNRVQKIYQSFMGQYPGPDDSPKLSGICEVIISPFDHCLTLEECELEIRSFCENPTAAQLKKFTQNENKNLDFLKQYLESHLFYHLDNWDFADDDSANQDNNEEIYTFCSHVSEIIGTFYSCPSIDNFYDLVNESYRPMIFLPEVNVRIWLNDDNTIHFELIKESLQEINNIINIAHNCGLHVDHNGYLTWWDPTAE